MKAQKKAMYGTIFWFLVAALTGFFFFAVLLVPGALLAWAMGLKITILTAFSLDIVAVFPISIVLGFMAFAFRDAYRENLRIALQQEANNN